MLKILEMQTLRDYYLLYVVGWKMFFSQAVGSMARNMTIVIFLCQGQIKYIFFFYKNKGTRLD